MEQTIGKRIATLRRSKSMTQDQLAEQLGVSPQAVSKWENDISCPDISLLPRLAEVFSVTTDWLLGMQETKEPTAQHEDVRWNICDEEAGEQDHNPNGLSFQWNFGKEDLPWFAVAVLVFAVSLLLNRTALAFMGEAGIWDLLWPSAILAWSASSLWSRLNLWGITMAGFGGFYLLTNLHILPRFDFLGWKIILPLLLILWAVHTLLAHFRRSNHDE